MNGLTNYLFLQGVKMIKYKENHCPVCKNTFKVAAGKSSRYYPPSKQVFCSYKCTSRGRYRHGHKCNEINPLDASYIAGFLDGEGSIMLISRGNCSWGSSISLRVTIAQSEKSKFILNWITGITGIGNSIISKARKEAHDHGWAWECNADAAESFLRQLLPFLRIKKEQARLGIEFHSKLRNPVYKSDTEWQVETRSIMKTLNRRGKRELTCASGG